MKTDTFPYLYNIFIMIIKWRLIRVRSKELGKTLNEDVQTGTSRCDCFVIESIYFGASCGKIGHRSL